MPDRWSSAPRAGGARILLVFGLLVASVAFGSPTLRYSVDQRGDARVDAAARNAFGYTRTRSGFANVSPIPFVRARHRARAVGG